MMAMPTQAFGSVVDILKLVQQDRNTPPKKANTLTVIVGAVVTTVITLIVYLIENDVQGLPGWLPQILPFLGFIATIFGVSKTKNGITNSQIKDVEDKINELIANKSDGRVEPFIPEPIATMDDTALKPIETNSIADELDSLAKNYRRRD